MTERRRPGQRRTLIVSLRDCEGCFRLRPHPTFMATYRAYAAGIGVDADWYAMSQIRSTSVT